MKLLVLFSLIAGYCNCFAVIERKVDSNKLQPNFVGPIEPIHYFPEGLKDLHKKTKDTAKSNDNQRIFGGAEVDPPNVLPFMAGILLSLPYGQKGWCGGTIISDQFILTAAHCLDKTINASVILGAHERLNTAEQTRETILTNRKNFIIHKKWDSKTGSNDIGLINLPVPIIHTTAIEPIALVDETFGTLDNIQASVSGWGYFNTSNILSPVLQIATTTTITNDACAEFYGRFVGVNNICTTGDEGQAVCNGDSGGPLVVLSEATNTFVQVGIASFGSGEGCDKLHPSVFTRISSYRVWVRTNAGV